MREINFRAYNQHGEKMFSWEDIKKEAKHITEMENIICLPLLKHVEYMQYTGLKDKNGVKIYEGDIARLHQHYLDNGEKIEKNRICQVVLLSYDKDKIPIAGFCIQTQNHNYIPISRLVGLHDESFEVIGNIYENPELLEA